MGAILNRLQEIDGKRGNREAGWGPRHLWGGVGAVVGFAIEYHVRQDIPWRQPFHVYNLWIFGLFAAQIIGAKLRQIQSPQDASSPHIYTLFGKR